MLSSRAIRKRSSILLTLLPSHARCVCRAGPSTIRVASLDLAPTEAFSNSPATIVVSDLAHRRCVDALAHFSGMMNFAKCGTLFMPPKSYALRHFQQPWQQELRDRYGVVDGQTNQG